MDQEIRVSEKARAYARLRYPVRVTVEDVDGTRTSVVEHPDLPGCIADGASLEEALVELAEVREEFIQVLMDGGAKIPLPTPIVSIASDGFPNSKTLPGQYEQGSLSGVFFPVPEYQFSEAVA